MLSLAASPMLTAHSAKFKPHRLPPFRWPGHQVMPCTLFAAFPSPFHSNLPLLVLKQLEANIPSNKGPFHVSKRHQAWWWPTEYRFPWKLCHGSRGLHRPPGGVKGQCPLWGSGSKAKPVVTVQNLHWTIPVHSPNVLLLHLKINIFFSHVHGSACNLWTCTSV